MAPTRKRTSLRAKSAGRTASQSSTPNLRPAKSPRDAISHPHSTFIPPAHITASLKAPADGYVDYDAEAGEGAWKTSKKDKRAMKHSVLMNKVRDAGVRKVKPRRPNNKLKTDLESLADALPQLEGMVGGSGEEDEWEGVDESGDEGMVGAGDGSGMGEKKRRRRTKKPSAEGKMEMKSLKHKPGAMKRKRVLEGREMERFGKNLAQLVGSVQRGGDVKAASSGGKQEGASPTPGVAAQADRWAALRGFIGGSMEQNPAFVKG
jgi:hypothetical protein